ncbi:MAG: heavy-metal-associated domain-containing protein, partial [Desulfobacterales bacterium]|nr:heavy-metal-associated domain-containing protein [Desulfobacterales bacterium]
MVEKRITIPVSGMTCANCAMNLERTLKKVPGIKSAAVNFASEQAGVSYDDTAVSVPGIVGAINRAGFEAQTFSSDFPVTGMTCA